MPRSIAPVIALAALTLGFGANAASYNRSVFSLPTPLTNFGSGHFAAGDLNGDGIRDFLIGSSDMGFRVAIGTADGRVVESPTYQMAGTNINALRLAHLDGDQNLDVIAVRTSTVEFAFGDGAGGFTPTQTLAHPGGISLQGTVAAVDLDGDGDLDVILVPTNSTYAVSTFLNDGTGAFAPGPNASIGSRVQSALGDIDGDGLTDLAWTIHSTVQVAFGTGGGAFSTATTVFSMNGVVNPQTIALGDVDHDGDGDIAFADGIAPQIRLIKYEPGTGFAAPIVMQDPEGDIANLMFLDLADGVNLAIVSVGWESIRVFPGSASGWGAPYTLTRPPNATIPVFVPADDHEREHFLLPGSRPAVEFTADGAGGLRYDRVALTSAHGTVERVTTYVGDLDGDGDTDLAVNGGVNSFRYFLNDSVGNFTARTYIARFVDPLFPTTDISVGEIAIGNFDADAAHEVYFNTSTPIGRRSFIADDNPAIAGLLDRTTMFVDDTLVHRPFAVDFERNGRDEIVALTGNTSVSLSLVVKRVNNGTLQSSSFPLPYTPAMGAIVAFVPGDFDGDGDIDFVAGFSQSNSLIRMRNNGGGLSFTSSLRPMSEIALDPSLTGLGAGDFDGDGDADLVYGAQQVWGVLQGDPGFTLTQSQQEMPDRGTFLNQGRTADFDGDSDIDVVFVDDAMPGIRLLINDGTGHLAFGDLVMGVGRSNTVSAADFDGDRRVDIVVTSLDTDQLEVMFGDRRRSRANFAPVATSDSALFNPNAASSVSDTLVGSDPDGDPLTYNFVAVSSGTITALNATTGAFTWTAPGGFSGTATLQFVANDGGADSNTATYTITAHNPAPTATASTASFSLNTASSHSGTLIARDVDNEVLTYSIVQVSAGSITAFNATTGAFTWAAPSGFSGSANIQFRASDGVSNSNTATYTISGQSTPVNLQIKLVGPRGTLYRNAVLPYSFTVKGLTKNVATRGTQVSLALPGGVTFVSGSIGGGSCAQVGNTVVCTSNSVLAAKGTLLGSISLRPSLTGVLTATATVHSAVSDTAMKNNSSTVKKTIKAPK